MGRKTGREGKGKVGKGRENDRRMGNARCAARNSSSTWSASTTCSWKVRQVATPPHVARRLPCVQSEVVISKHTVRSHITVSLETFGKL